MPPNFKPLAGMPQDPFIREKFTRERSAARKLAAEYFERFPKVRYQTVERPSVLVAVDRLRRAVADNSGGMT
jgi:hypothetical protein